MRQQSHRKMLIDAFVNALYLYDDKLVLTFNYKDGTRTITLDDVKEAVKNNTGSDLDCLGAPKEEAPPWGPLLLISEEPGSNPSKCNAPVGDFQTPAGRRLLLELIESGHRRRKPSFLIL